MLQPVQNLSKFSIKMNIFCAFSGDMWHLRSENVLHPAYYIVYSVWSGLITLLHDFTPWRRIHAVK